MSYSWDHAGRAAEMVRIDDARRRDDEWRDDVRAQNDRARAAYDLMLPEARRQSDAQERIAAALEAIAGTSAAETTRAEHAAALGLATARIRELEGERDRALDALRDEEKKTYAEKRETHTARLERDELLGLVRECRGRTSCATGSSGDPCKRHGESDVLCAECRRRAIVARIEKATKGTT